MTTPGALARLKVLDFTWVIAGPLATKLLAEHGATVVRVESRLSIDASRTYPLWVKGPGLDHAIHFIMYNNDKHHMLLNLKNPAAKPVIERLVRWADVAVENFVPGTMERLGLGYDALRAINPALIMLRVSLFGQTGPYAPQSGFGWMMQAIAGHTALVGWPDRPPVGTQVPYTDFIAPWYVVTLLMAALDYRRQTGEGQCIDLSQMEAGLHFMAPLLLDAAENGRTAMRDGNRQPDMSPHGVFRCQGEERWCAIVARDDGDWQRLCRAMGDPAWAAESRFGTFFGRKAHEDELEKRIGGWTATLPPEQVMAILLDAGVPAGLVAAGSDLHADAQLAARDHFVPLIHEEIGPLLHDAPSFRMSKTPGGPSRAAPLMGEHNEFICRELLGFTDEEFVSMLEAGAFE